MINYTKGKKKLNQLNLNRKKLERTGLNLVQTVTSTEKEKSTFFDNEFQSKMERWVGQVALVTGASSGIGKSVSEELCKIGVNVIGLARRIEKLEKLSELLKSQKGKFLPYQADITVEEDIIRAFEWAINNIGPVSILINNAGVARNTTLVDGNTENWREVLDTNVMGLAIASKEAIKIMRKNNINGHIVNISSVAGHYVPMIPNVNVYSASKFAITSLSETLRRELLQLGSKIKVSNVSPGFTRTEIVEAGGFNENKEIEELVKMAPYMLPVDVANCVLAVLATPPHVHVTEMIVRPLGEPC